MREFPNATPRPWRLRLTDDCSVTGPNCEEIATTYGVFRDAYADNYEGMEADAALIVHAVNTYETRKKLLEEAAAGIRALTEELTCPVNGAHYCPNCDNSLFGALHRAHELLAKLEARYA